DRGERNGSTLRQHRLGRAARLREGAEQTVRADLGDRHRRNVAEHCRWPRDLNRLEIWGASDDLARMASRLFEQDLEAAPAASRVECGLLAVDDGLQAEEPLGFHLVRD